MHKLSLSCISFLIMAAPAWAQIKLNNNGNIAVGTTTVSALYKLRVECTSSTNCGAGPPYRYGIYGVADGGYSNYGIYGRATGTVNNYGVRGYASGGSNNWAGYFSGSVYATGTYEGSDARLKTDVRSLRDSNMLAKVLQLEPRRYRYMNAAEAKQQGLPEMGLPEGEHLGLLAQEVEQVFPEVVIDVVHPADVDEAGDPGELVVTKAVNYTELIPVLIEAIREQQAEIEELKAVLEANGLK